MKGLRRFVALPLARQRCLLAAVCLLPLARVGLRYVGYSRLRRLARAWCPVNRSSPEPAVALAIAKRLCSDVGAAAMHGRSGATCLPQAIVTWVMLRRRGIEGEIRLGARVVDARLEAHAWVEVGGVSLEAARDSAGSAAAAFAPFRRFA